MLVVATVLRCRFIRKYFVESHVVAIDSITCWTTNDQVVRIAQVTNQRSHSDVHHVVAKAPAIGPSTRNEPAILEWILNVALEHVAAEDAQPRVSIVVGVIWTTSGKAHFARRQVDLD